MNSVGEPRPQHPDEETVHPAVQSQQRRGQLSFVRRTSRLSPSQERAWESAHENYVIEPPRFDGVTSVDPTWTLDPQETFGRTAPFVVEVGTGRGDNIAAAAAQHPDTDFLGIEVYVPGIASTIMRAQQHAELAGLTRLNNLRMIEANAPEVLTSALPESSIDELWVFFPDPWPKAKHHKRRIVAPPFVNAVARSLKPGGLWRLATDWPEYAEQMLDVLDTSKDFINVCGLGGVAPRFDGRVLTRFEERGLAEGRPATDLTYRRQ
ncbi:MAG: tRNA (guanosine(46)-N7)-methyltransferase TrmB [Cellulomonadaceae bacterium]|jgi:tRNA (guanine-N7-)-methyltransferase|nr:tRNA (guanosine(46)-N7)-methyltransferase TrmB [Cellulomonadaceae bacterium]